MCHRVVILRCVLLSSVAVFSSSCSTFNQLAHLGETPKLSPVKNPTTEPGYKPVQMPMPTPQPATYNPNSLWRNGSRAFFNDQRAHQVGDILTVKVNVNDTAEFQDQTQLTRSTTEDSNITNFIGANTIANPAKAVLPGSVLAADGNTQMQGNGSINRQDQLVTNIAAVVTQVLPNGNLVIDGHQQVRVNNELRDMRVSGIVRREDITQGNTVDLAQIAEARISYGGQGTVSDMQQPRYGSQLFDIVMPW